MVQLDIKYKMLGDDNICICRACIEKCVKLHRMANVFAVLWAAPFILLAVFSAIAVIFEYAGNENLIPVLIGIAAVLVLPSIVIFRHVRKRRYRRYNQETGIDSKNCGNADLVVRQYQLKRTEPLFLDDTDRKNLAILTDSQYASLK